MKVRTLSEAVGITPVERERAGLPSYLDRILPVGQKLVGRGKPPVAPRQDRWTVADEPERLVRTFVFSDPRVLASFMLDIIDYEHQTQHHGVVTMECDKVSVEVWTHDIDRVTQADIDYAETLDEIFIDVTRRFRDLM